MKTKVHKRLVRIAGLLALSLFVLAMAAQAAQAAVIHGSGGASLPPNIMIALNTAQSGATLPQPSANRVPGTHPRTGATSSGGWSTADWVGMGLVAAALFIAGLTAWALLRRSRPLGEPTSVTSIAPSGASSPPQPVSEEDTRRRAA